GPAPPWSPTSGASPNWCERSTSSRAVAAGAGLPGRSAGTDADRSRSVEGRPARRRTRPRARAGPAAAPGGRVTRPAGPNTGPRPVISPFAFPPEEYQGRVARARQAMQAGRLDALLLCDDRSVFYFTGAGGATPREDKARPQFVLVPVVGEVTALVSHARAIPFRESSWVPELRTYDGLGTDLVRGALADLVQEAAPRARTVGMELGSEQRLGMSVTEYEALRARFPDRRFVDAAGVLWSLRMVKSPAELARIEQAVRITDQAFAAV